MARGPVCHAPFDEGPDGLRIGWEVQLSSAGTQGPRSGRARASKARDPADRRKPGSAYGPTKAHAPTSTASSPAGEPLCIPVASLGSVDPWGWLGSGFSGSAHVLRNLPPSGPAVTS